MPAGRNLQIVIPNCPMTFAADVGLVLIAGVEASRYIRRGFGIGATNLDLLSASRRFFVKSSETIFRWVAWVGKAITLVMLETSKIRSQSKDVVNSGL